MQAGTIALGAVTRTGSAVILAVRPGADGPSFAGRWEITLVPDGMPDQPFHAAAAEPHRAGRLVSDVEQAAERAAVAALTEAAHGRPVLGIAVLVKPVSAPSDIDAVLRSHAWMHAAEGALYREAVLSAGRQLGWVVHAVDAATLRAQDELVAAIGAAAGRPWRRAEKDAVRAALTLLPLDITNCLAELTERLGNAGQRPGSVEAAGVRQDPEACAAQPVFLRADDGARAGEGDAVGGDARDGDDARPTGTDQREQAVRAFLEFGRRELGGLRGSAGCDVADAKSEVSEFGLFGWFQLPAGEAGQVQRGPEPVPGPGEVPAGGRRVQSRVDAAEQHPERLALRGQHVRDGRVTRGSQVEPHVPLTLDGDGTSGSSRMRLILQR